MGVKLAGAPALDAYLHQSFDLIQYVADNMATIKAVASHLTPVEDLVDFRDTIAELHGKLGLLVEASELIIQTTPAGIQLLLAPDAAAQRLVMGLGSAAVKDADFFAKTTEFTALSNYVDEIKLIVDQLVEDMAERVTHAELDTTVADLLGKIAKLVTQDQLDARIREVVGDSNDGNTITALRSLVTQLTSRITDAEHGLDGQATLLGTLTTKVTQTAAGIDALSQNMVVLRAEVTDAAGQAAGNSEAIGGLSTRTSELEGRVTAQAEDLTQLSAKADNLATELSAQADAVHSLEVFATNTDGEQKTTAAEVTQLAGRLVDAENNLAANVQATRELTTSLEATQAGLVITAENITQLQSSITGTGNLLPNSAFEVDTRAWTLYSRGAGWLAAKLQLNLDAERIPQGLNVLSLTAGGVPAGQAGIRSNRLPISALTRYILSGYLAAENCTLQMEWRLFDAGGLQIGAGTVGLATDVSPPANLVNWLRVHTDFRTSADAALLEVQLWVKNCHTGPPKVWFLRPMMEEAVGTQTEPSPWTPGVNGLEESMATAMQALTTRVESTEEGLLAAAESVTQLASRIGNVVTWRVVTLAGSGDAASVGAPLEPSIRVAGKDEADYTFQRGLTLVRFTVNGAIDSATRYDTFSNATERANLTAALNALGPNDGFLLVSCDNHGIKNAALTAAMERCGALNFVNVTGSSPYALRGRGGIGKGGGIENYPLSENQWIDFTFSTTNDMPQGLGEQGAIAGVAIAVQELTTQVTEMDGKVTAATTAVTGMDSRVNEVEAGLLQEGQTRATADDALASANTALTVRTKDAEAALVEALILRATKDAVIVNQVNRMDGRLSSAETGLTAAVATVSGYESRMTDAEGKLTSQSSQIDSLHNDIATVDGKVLVTNTTLSALASEVTAQGDDLLAQGSAITSLRSDLSTTDGKTNANATAITGISTRVTATEGSLTAQSSRIDGISASVGANTAAINNEATTRAAADSANATNISNLSTTVGGHTASITNVQTSLNGVLARAGVSTDVNGYLTGWVLNNNGASGSFDVLANRFSVVDPVDGSRSLKYENGNLVVSGVVEGSVMRASALELGSTRIHTGGGRLAPFVIRDVACFNAGAINNANRTLTLDNFVSPNYGGGYHYKRFAAQVIDVFIDVMTDCDHPTNQFASETVNIQRSVDGGPWVNIVSVTGRASYASPIPITVRYTTPSAWSTIAFQAATTQGNTVAMSISVMVLNFNTSGNAPDSNSGVSGAVSAPPPANGGGGTPFCVDWETTVLPDGRYVRDLVEGDLVEVVDVRSGERSLVPLLAMGVGYENCYLVETLHGAVIQSVSTPMDMRDGSVLRTSELAGHELLTHAHGWEIAEIRFMGMRKVCKPDFGDRMFFAGIARDKTLATHNVRFKPDP